MTTNTNEAGCLDNSVHIGPRKRKLQSPFDAPFPRAYHSVVHSSTFLSRTVIVIIPHRPNPFPSRPSVLSSLPLQECGSRSVRPNSQTPVQWVARMMDGEVVTVAVVAAQSLLHRGCGLGNDGNSLDVMRLSAASMIAGREQTGGGRWWMEKGEARSSCSSLVATRLRGMEAAGEAGSGTGNVQGRIHCWSLLGLGMRMKRWRMVETRVEG